MKQNYPYTCIWVDRPLIQLPKDIMRNQEVFFRLKPDVLFESGTAHGGSLVLWVGLCKIMGKGLIIRIDIEIRPYNRQAIEAKELFLWVTLIKGCSTDAEIVQKHGA